jgi:predicted ATP-grasp superfamily ATP-dependent carboligase
MTAVDNSTPILALGMQNDHLHHGILGIARSAGRMGIDVYAVSRSRWAPLAMSRYLAGVIVAPRPGTDAEWLSNLASFAAQHGPRPVLVPVDDTASVFVDDHAEYLAPLFRFPVRPPELTRRLASKRELHELCLELRIPSPGASFPESRDELAALLLDAAPPYVLKSIAGWLRPRGAPSVAVVHDRTAALAAYDLMASPDTPNVMLQEYVPGGPSSVWMFNGYFDADSNCATGFTGYKIRQYPPQSGFTTLGICAANSAVDRDIRTLLKTVGYRGIVDVGFRFDAGDGQYKLLDVNPRLGATFRLFVGADGTDVLRALYLDLTGQDAPTSRLMEGRRWWVEPFDLISSVDSRRQGGETWGEWLRSLRGVRESAWFAFDDPLPALGLGAVAAASVVRRSSFG